MDDVNEICTAAAECWLKCWDKMYPDAPQPLTLLTSDVAALSAAVTGGVVEEIQEILGRKPELARHVDPMGEPLVCLAARFGNATAARLLVLHGAKPMDECNKVSAVGSAVLGGHTQVFLEFARLQLSVANQLDSSGRSAVHYAALRSRAGDPILDAIKSADGDFTQVCGRGMYHGMTVCHIAVIENPEVLPDLVRLGAQMTVPDRYGRTPLDLARRFRTPQERAAIAKLVVK